MTMSIVHRVTGVALYFGTLVLTWWLIAIAMGPGAYAFQQRFLGSALGLLILFGFTWAILHHALGGVRHLVWDTGRAHGYPWREYLARATIVGSLALTIVLWGVFYLM
jgi:succinate dehydrogenase / fumarate reductase cytochrome b subunit